MSERRLAHLIKTIPIKGGGSMPALIPAYDYSSGYVEAKKLSPKITKYAPRLQKRLIVCCDGTWNNGLSTSPFSSTNVLKLARSIFPEDRQTFPPIPQLVFYQTGLGILFFSFLRLAQGATGAGVLTKIREAYAFIAQNYIPGDEVFLFGFSRGAFTARTIATLIADIGILTNAGMADFYQVLAAYQVRGKGNEKSEKAERFLDNYRRGGPKRMREMPEGTLKCVGVWDTVGAFGILLTFTLILHETAHFFEKTHSILGFRDTKLSHQIKFAFHAIAIHETRVDFMPTKWRKHPPTPGSKECQVFKQVWFSGSHSDVGGGNEKHDLSSVSLFWMVANLIEHKLLSIDEDYLLSLPAPKDDWGRQIPTDPRQGLMSLSEETIRSVPTVYNCFTREKIHRSVEFQPSLDPEIAKIFESKESCMIEELLPFEIKMRQKWELLKLMSASSKRFNIDSQEVLEAPNDDDESAGKKTSFKDLLGSIIDKIDIRKFMLRPGENSENSEIFDEDFDEVLAYQALETPTPSNQDKFLYHFSK
ncbi:hypothetical protein BY996DRAFT_4575750 [Phakopsora pachyrhizi]|nr:hypothetical protein BY996DRAFT_4575750 [Phakopsora pachyrhizi]